MRQCLFIVGVGKKKAWRFWLQNFELFCSIFNNLNISSTPSYINAAQKAFIIIYTGDTKADVADIDECRFLMYDRGVAMHKLPPTSRTLAQHTRRAIYQAEIWKRSLQKKQQLPSPLDWGWELDESGQLVPLWTTGLSAATITDLIHHCGCKSICGVRCSCKRKDLKCTSLCSCNYKVCNFGDTSRSSSTPITESSLSRRNVFDYLESLQ